MEEDLKRTELKKKKTTPSAKLKGRCDVLWAKAVKLRAEGLCEFCAKPGADSHHMVGRTAVYLRHALPNGVFLCKGCHFRFHNRESLFLWDWMRVHRPEDYQYVLDHRQEICKRRDYGIVETALKAWLSEFELSTQMDAFNDGLRA